MEHSGKLTEMDPMPMWSPAPSDHGAQRSRSPLIPTGDFDGPRMEGMAPHTEHKGYKTERSGSAAPYSHPEYQPMPPPPPQQQMYAPPPTEPMMMTPGPYMQEPEALDIDTLRQSCQYNLRGYLALKQDYRRYGGNASDGRLQSQTDLVLSDLLGLQMEVRNLAREAQNHRWRKWLMGGIFASFIPLVRRIFRRSNDEDSKVASNDTEYAFQRSRNILARIKDILDAASEPEFHTTQAHGEFHLEMASEEDAVNPSSAPTEAVSEETQEQKDRRFRKLYSNPPDFKQLAALDADFSAVVQGRDLDFRDPKAVMQLSKTLLKHDFGLSLDLPDDRLCPPIPNRHKYILWLKDLVDFTTYNAPGGKLVGIDIGTGASCIYPMLGCTQRPWCFIAADIDDESLRWASKNIEQNHLQNRIKLVKSNPDGPIIPIDSTPATEEVAFVMTNPPFYRSAAEMDERAAEKALPPLTACTGAPVEMVTDGGEVAFVGRILDESLALRGRIQWYTAMLGFLSSVAALVQRLRDNGVGNYAVTEFVQGRKTKRWAVAWSFRAMRPPQAIARGAVAGSLKGYLPAHTEMTVVEFPEFHRVSEFASRLRDAIAALEAIHWEWDRQKLEGTLRVADKVWTRAWRRQKQRGMDTSLEGEERPVKEELGFGIYINVNLNGVLVRCRWIEGHDESVFISFSGYLKTTAKSVHSSLDETKKPEKTE
ncbi:Putative methyltransferase-like protein C27D7.08c [Beauveria bassiana D1-5]|uniref:Putative methyltransferase-like protein C27D7.08c n=1 Tax=Beauveria bassiana D1-5 TaxID=1245745 RepID=A0A0A2VLC2_BEABA|nr:Putative methyltransferase-like protein C27D7.08c [Beauveria bassiana D1-5]